MATKDILLVDDDSNCREVMISLLERKGFDVSAASGGVEALDILKRDRFAIMITDLIMPGMNGVELARRVGELNPKMVIILVTGSNIASEIELAEQAGIARVLPKPVEYSQFLMVVKSALGLSSLR